MTADAIVLMTRIAVLGTGSALPGSAISTSDLIAKAAPFLSSTVVPLAHRVAKRLGIDSRHLVRCLDAPIESPRAADIAPKLAARAVVAALADAGREVGALRLLIGHTATPHTLLPSNIAWAADELGYAGAHTELRQACTGFAAATLFAAGLITADTGPVAIVGSETGSVMFDPREIANDPAQLVNLVQMGDGAGAVVLAPLKRASAARIELVFYGSAGMHRAPGLTIKAGGSAAPRVGTAGVPHFTHDFTAIREHGMALLRNGIQIAAQAGFAPGDIDWWLPHQANGRMPALCAKWLRLPPERVICNAGTLGNLGSAAIWVALDRLRRSGRLTPGDRVFVLGAEATKYMYGGFLYVHGE